MVDVILRLIDSNALNRLRSMSIEQLVLAFESGRLGGERPAGDPPELVGRFALRTEQPPDLTLFTGERDGMRGYVVRAVLRQRDEKK